MRIHTNTPDALVTATQALIKAKDAGLIAPDVYFDKAIRATRSTTHASAVDIHLATDTKEPGSKRRRPNSGQYGYDGSPIWAATWDEWGWFFSALFVLDPSAKAAPYYPDRDAFHAATAGKFRTAATPAAAVPAGAR